MKLKAIMKKSIILIASIFLSNYVRSQAVIGMGAAAINLKSVGFNLQAGITFGKEEIENRQKANYLYYSQTVNNARGDKPQILALHYGRNFGTIQPYIGGAYHLGRTDVKNSKVSGFCAEYGLTKYFKHIPLGVSVGQSGKITIISVFIYKIL